MVCEVLSAELAAKYVSRVSVHIMGKPKDKDLARKLQDYVDRVKGRGISLVIFPDRIGSEGYESKLSELPGDLVLVDQEGQEMTSKVLSSWLSSKKLDRMPTHLAIGPAEGFSKKLKNSASSAISLSRLTFTHELAALILMEQLYRATEIERGSTYHRE